MTNPYEQDKFWKQYKEYAAESIKRHGAAIGMLLKYANFVGALEGSIDLLDLGCGPFLRAKDLILTETDHYFGIDSAVEIDDDRMVKLDYRNPDVDFRAECPFIPNCFVSLFSTELTAEADDNQILYEKLFREFPTIKWAIVSGFYYGDIWTRHEKTVRETAGIYSHQSGNLHDNLADCRSELYDEVRILLRAPSKMFGPDPIEVWKLLVRKAN